MKFSGFAAAALAAASVAGSAFAADLPSRKAPPSLIAPAPALTWSGFYVGLNAGYSWDASNSTTISTMPGFIDTSGGLSPLGMAHAADFALASNGVLAGGGRGGFIGGGQVGFNWQMGSIVAGIETDIQGMVGQGSSSGAGANIASMGGESPVASLMNASRTIDYLGTLRGRLGYAITPSVLAFATGGLAYGGVSSSGSVYSAEVVPSGILPAMTAGSYASMRVGWTAGAGVEYMFAQNWSAKLEYMYYDLGSSTYAMAPLVSTNAGALALAHIPMVSTRYNGHIIRAGLNYHFNFGDSAPIVAKY